jgi:hypothetical protein
LRTEKAIGGAISRDATSESFQLSQNIHDSSATRVRLSRTAMVRTLVAAAETPMTSHITFDMRTPDERSL